MIYGDSISTSLVGDGGYEVKLRENLGLKTFCNHAIAASGMSTATPDNLVTLLENSANLHADADLIILWHGTNDWYWGSEVGEIGSEDPATFSGALCKNVRTIRAAAPRAQLVCLTPIFRWQQPDGCETLAEAYQNPNKLGYTMKEYIDVIYAAAQLMCFRVIDMRTLSGISAENEKLYLSDGIHPNKAGCELIADIITRALV